MERALGKAGFSQEVGMLSGLLNERSSGGHYDRLRDRVTFPIANLSNRTIAFGARALQSDQEPKYLNSPETSVYHKGRVLYGLADTRDAVRRRDCVLVVEGYIDNIKIQGKITGSQYQIRNKIAGIKESRPLRATVLERYMLLLNDLPGLSAQSILRPSASVSGASDLIIVVKESHVGGAVSVDNRGTRFIGPNQGIATFNFSNLMGLYDQTQIRFIMSGDFGLPGSHNTLRYGSFTHIQQLTSGGTTLAISASRTLPDRSRFWRRLTSVVVRPNIRRL
jgi:hypothetical protein